MLKRQDNPWNDTKGFVVSDNHEAFFVELDLLV